MGIRTTLYPKAQKRFCLMVRTVAMDRPMASGTPRMSLPTRETSRRGYGDVRSGSDGYANVRLGQRRGVVDAVAHHGHRLTLGLQRARTSISFWSGGASASTMPIPNWPAMAWAVRCVSPVYITTSNPQPPQGVNGLLRLGLQHVGQGDDPAHLAVYGYEHRRLALAGKAPVRWIPTHSGRTHVSRISARFPIVRSAPFTLALMPWPGQRLKLGYFLPGQPPVVCGGGYGLPQGMLRVPAPPTQPGPAPHPRYVRPPLSGR